MLAWLGYYEVQRWNQSRLAAEAFNYRNQVSILGDASVESARHRGKARVVVADKESLAPPGSGKGVSTSG